MIVRVRTLRIALLVSLLPAALAGCASNGDSWSSKSAPSPTTMPAPDGQWTFNTPEAAVEAMIAAARARDRETMKSIFGPDLELLESGDERQDRIDLQQFTAAYDLRHSLVRHDSNTRTLVMGVHDWIFPAPIIRESKRWKFDTAAGVQEIMLRTIGMNELHLIYTTASTFAAAQKSYFEMDPDGDGVKAYSPRFRSTPGKRDGLYWPDEEGAPMSPLGPFFAQAVAEGDVNLADQKPQPYRGYYYRILTSQGAGAPGGAMNYMDDAGRMTRGYALLAWPAAYAETGVMSFIVAADGIVYQKDLGEESEAEAAKITTFDPAGWDLAVD